MLANLRVKASIVYVHDVTKNGVIYLDEVVVDRNDRL